MYIGYFSHYYDKIPDPPPKKKQLEEGRVYIDSPFKDAVYQGGEVLATCDGGGWSQESEVRKQRAASHHLPPSFSLTP